jgi:hypothetical protein
VLRPAPGGPISTAGELACWERKDKSYLDLPGWLRLRGEAGSRSQPSVRVSLLEPSRDSEPRVRELRANEDGLFDVTDLGIV